MPETKEHGMSVSSTAPTCAAAGTHANLSTADYYCYGDCPVGATAAYPYCITQSACPSGWTLESDHTGCIAPTLARHITAPGTPHNGLTCSPNTVYNAPDDTCRSQCGSGSGTFAQYSYALSADICVPPCPNGLIFAGATCEFPYTTLTGVASECPSGKTLSGDGSACCPTGYSFSPNNALCLPPGTPQGGTGTGSGTGTGTGAAAAGLPFWWWILLILVIALLVTVGIVAVSAQSRLHKTIKCVDGGAGKSTLTACVDGSLKVGAGTGLGAAAPPPPHAAANRAPPLALVPPPPPPRAAAPSASRARPHPTRVSHSRR